MISRFIPDNISKTKESTISFPNTPDGLSYFHLKPMKNGIWGGTTDFLIRIDTTPPAGFKPKVEVFTATAISTKALVSFFTTDALSGVDHYEIGIIKKSDPASVSPVFVEANSPYQLPLDVSNDMRVIVRAFDNAGNVRDEIVDVDIPSSVFGFFSNNILIILLLLLLLVCISALFATNYLFGLQLKLMRLRLERAVEIARLKEVIKWTRWALEREENVLPMTDVSTGGGNRENDF